MARSKAQPKQSRIEWQFSARQLFTMLWWKLPECAGADGFVADGPIRAGKTVGITLGYVMWIMETFDGMSFILGGKTLKSLERNVVTPLKSYAPSLGVSISHNKSDNLLILTNRRGVSNTIYLFGGKDEGSQDLVQGMTAAGAYLDEVVLMPESFVNQVLARCSVTGAKIWMNCNPAGPNHFVKAKIIDRYREKNFIYCHYTMDDNLSLSQERRDFYRRQYTGVFYRRYILGEWCLADGLVYSCYDSESMGFGGDIDWSAYSEIEVGYDYGIQNTTAFVMVGYNVVRERVEVIKTWGHSGRDTGRQKTDDELYDDLVEFIGDAPVQYVYGDPSATSFHAVIRKKGQFRDREADNSVLDGIGFVSMLFNLSQLAVHEENCNGLVRELGSYAWDSEKSEKEGKDIVLKVNDHYCDALRYVLYTYYFPRSRQYRLGSYAS